MTQIIPAIDIIDGKCVRLTKGDYTQKTAYADSPLDVAMRFEDAGIKRLHLVDLDGAKAKHIINHKPLEQIASKTDLWIDFGGGVQSDEDIKIAFNSGAAQITAGSIAAKNKALVKKWLTVYGSEKIILGADVKEGKIAISGWEENADIDLNDFVADYEKLGIQTIISTDVQKDGMLEGPSFDLYKRLQDDFPKMNIIASGGVAGIQDVERLVEMNVFGVIIGKAYYEGKITLKDLKPYLG